MTKNDLKCLVVLASASISWLSTAEAFLRVAASIVALALGVLQIIRVFQRLRSGDGVSQAEERERE